jgi:glycosyltransferase involved in cell wall biosynthesis
MKRAGIVPWIAMETVDDTSALGFLKRRYYSSWFARAGQSVAGVLAIGHRTPEWLTDRGVPDEKLFPFAYFLEDQPELQASGPSGNGPFRVAFVGQFIDRKRLPLLVDALEQLKPAPTELVVVGSGPRVEEWRWYANRRLPGRITWLGKVDRSSIPGILRDVDCLVLPSKYDGWGAVVSEALLCGTQAVCSSSCGAAGVVACSGQGGVFTGDRPSDLASVLERIVTAGPPTLRERQALATWARCLGARAGANYFLEILSHMKGQRPRPLAPWLVGTN